VLKVVHILT